MPTYRTDGSWLPVEDVLAQLQLPAAPTEAQRADAERYRLAAAAYVERVRADLVTVAITAEATDVGFDASPDIVAGAALLAARLYARKGSPTGLASYGEFGPAAVLRFDPDVERLLGVGRYARPAVG